MFKTKDNQRFVVEKDQRIGNQLVNCGSASEMHHKSGSKFSSFCYQLIMKKSNLSFLFCDRLGLNTLRVLCFE